MTLQRIYIGITSRLRALWYRFLGMKLLGKVWLRNIDIPRLHQYITLHPGVALDRDVTLILSEVSERPSLEIGSSVYINRNTIIDVSGEMTIGEEALIGPFCYLTDHDHDAEHVGLITKNTTIGKRAWLGAHVSVLKGVTIGDDVVIGAGSVVTKDIPAGATAVGNPARVIKAKS